jgi:hypothetical protein
MQLDWSQLNLTPKILDDFAPLPSKVKECKKRYRENFYHFIHYGKILSLKPNIFVKIMYLRPCTFKKGIISPRRTINDTTKHTFLVGFAEIPLLQYRQGGPSPKRWGALIVAQSGFQCFKNSHKIRYTKYWSTGWGGWAMGILMTPCWYLLHPLPHTANTTRMSAVLTSLLFSLPYVRQVESCLCMLTEEWDLKKRKTNEGTMGVFFLRDKKYYILTNTMNL